MGGRWFSGAEHLASSGFAIRCDRAERSLPARPRGDVIPSLVAADFRLGPGCPRRLGQHRPLRRSAPTRPRSRRRRVGATLARGCDSGRGPRGMSARSTTRGEGAPVGGGARAGARDLGGGAASRITRGAGAAGADYWGRGAMATTTMAGARGGDADGRAGARADFHDGPRERQRRRRGHGGRRSTWPCRASRRPATRRASPSLPDRLRATGTPTFTLANMFT